ncbi:hypothetical protein ABH926_005736 [Catenulispora sp. GP43]|uniref:hypothetical protein n=1 Tax=Catenulispora sp. GP43 TaxID=3156263 RepID=UPI003514DE28
MSSTDHPVPGPDEAGGGPDPAAAPSRARLAGYGWLPWAAGAMVAATQVLMVVLGSGPWRTVGVAGLIFVTLAAIGFAMFGEEGKR